MDPRLLFVFVAFTLSLIMGIFIIPRVIIVAKRKRLFDKIDKRKEAKPPTPRLGGLTFFPISMLSFVLMLGLRYQLGYDIASQMESELIINFMFVTAGLLMIFFVGLADDLIEVDFKAKFVVQFLCAGVLTYAGLDVVSFQGLFGIYGVNEVLAGCISILFMVYVINVYNLIDGVNGLCSGLGSVALTTYAAWFIYCQNYVCAMLAASLLGVVLAFFRYNVRGKRLQIFMGDTGSLTIGFMISFFTLKCIILGQITPGLYVPNSTIALTTGLIFIPFFDALRVMLNRIRQKRSPFFPDRTHVHHKLLDVGFTHIQSTLLLITAQVCFFLLNILLSEIMELNVNIVIGLDITLAIGVNHMLNRKIATVRQNQPETVLGPTYNARGV